MKTTPEKDTTQKKTGKENIENEVEKGEIAGGVEKEEPHQRAMKTGKEEPHQRAMKTGKENIENEVEKGEIAGGVEKEEPHQREMKDEEVKEKDPRAETEER